MSLSIEGHKADLRNKINQYGNQLATTRNINTSSIYNSQTGIMLTQKQQQQMKVSIFNVTGGDQTNSTAQAQNNKNQTQTSNATTTFAQFIVNTANDAVNNLTNIINTLMQKLDALSADQSALTSPQTTGQTVNPHDSMPTNNNGGENKPATASDSQKPNVGFGEETVTNKPEKQDVDEPKTNPQEQQKQESIFNAQTSSDIDKAAEKESKKQFQQAQQKLNQEADKISQLLSSTAA